VHSVDVVYCFTDSMIQRELDRELAILDAAETARRESLVFATDRRDYTVAHALLRRALSRRRPVPPEAWRFEPSEAGKPQIAAHLKEGSCLQFSLSHTRGLVACAVGDGIDIGVDVEAIGRSGAADDLVSRLFSPSEARDLASRPLPDRHIRFIELWSLKEAYLKANGLGLTQPLDSCGFEFISESNLQFQHDGAGGGPWRFTLYALGETEAFRLAVAVRSRDAALDHPLRVRDMRGDSHDARLIRASSHAGAR
jgi:4'-phosphopantetheinyl transferase